MNYPREQRFKALFDLVSSATIYGIPAFKFCTRKYMTWTEVTEALQPALVQQQGSQRASSFRNYGETLWTPEVYEWIYIMHDPNDEIIPATYVNNYLDAIEAVLMPDPSGRQTLGGLVEHCYIDGEVVADEGNDPSDVQIVIKVPVKINTGI